jgi:transposase
LTHAPLTELRTRRVNTDQNGEIPELDASISWATVYDWPAPNRNGGWDALKISKRGGHNLKLDSKMLKCVDAAVTMGNPFQFKFAFRS